MTSRMEKYGKKRKPSKTKGRSNLKLRVGVVVLLTLAQWGGFYGINRYLEPSTSVATTAQASGVSAQAEEAPAVTAPADAVSQSLSYDKQHVAYTTSDGKLVILDKSGKTFEKELNGDVMYMEWLGHSNTLLYGVQGTYLDAWLLPAQGNEPVLIHEWWGKERKVTKTYFSSYMEFLYLEVENEQNQTTEVYKYDALGGISQLPLENVKIDSIDYDEKTDIMKLTQTNGGVWRYEKDRLYRPDGSEVYQQTIVHHQPVTGNSSILNPSDGTGNKTEPGKTEPANGNGQSNGTQTGNGQGNGTDTNGNGGTGTNGGTGGGTGGTTNGGTNTGGGANGGTGNGTGNGGA
ncbi:MAG: hypothetical protein ACXVP2_13345, partial [Tumebacillaceae bacterium]